MTNKIRECRKRKGLSQEELANKIGVKRAVVSKYETGKISPRIEIIQKISRVLGVPVHELVGDTMYIDTVENISTLLSSGKATPENLAKKLKEHHPNTPDDELLRVQQYADKLRDYEKDARHEQAVSLLLALPEEQREAVYMIIEAISRKE